MKNHDLLLLFLLATVKVSGDPLPSDFTSTVSWDNGLRQVDEDMADKCLLSGLMA